MSASRLVRGVALAAACVPMRATAQLPEPVAELSTDSVRVAEVFELRIEVPVPSGSMVYFPDTVPPTDDVESSAPVEWRARRGPDGGATLELTYALMPFGTGVIDLPPVEVLVMPLEEEAEGERVPGGSLVGVWEERQPSVRYTRRVVPPRIWVAPVYTAEDVVAGMRPRGPDDVVGFGWSWLSVVLLLAFSTVISGTVVTTTRRWLATRGEAPAAPSPKSTSLDEARRQALAELDRLMGSGPYPAERARDLYEASSRVLRGYVERLDPGWGPELTSTELMRRLTTRSPDDGTLEAEMRTAEAVKFGRLRPDAGPTEAHLNALRTWLAGRSEGHA